MPQEFYTKTIYQPNFKVGTKTFTVNHGTKFKIGKTSTLDKDVEAYLAYMGSIGCRNSTKEIALDAFVKSAKKYNYWKDIELLYLPVWGSSSINSINLKDIGNNSFTLNQGVNSITESCGYLSMPSTITQNSFINTMASPSSLGMSAAKSFYSVGIKSATSSTTKETVFGARTSNGDVSFFIQNNLFTAKYGTQSTAVTHDTGTNLWTLNVDPDSNGGNISFYKNSTLQSTVSAAGDMVPANPIYIGALNVGGADYLNAATDQYSLFCMGKGLKNVAQYTSDINTLLSAIG